MEWFYIYRYKGNGLASELGRTRYLEDAQRVLSNYYSGYIASGGKILEKKNMDI